MIPPKERFSVRVEYYLQYRPHLPFEVVDTLKRELGLLGEWVVADVGSGTGFSSAPFLHNGNRVIGIEPNREMREVAEKYLVKYGEQFTSIDGCAEATTLEDSSVDLVVVGHAFHWFDTAQFRAECNRILRDPTNVVLMSNSGDPNREDMNEIKRIIHGYQIEHDEEKRYQHDESRVTAFFSEHGFRKFEIPNQHSLTFEELLGRICSMSYSPLPGHDRYGLMVDDLRSVFDRFSENGKMIMYHIGYLTIGGS